MAATAEPYRRTVTLRVKTGTTETGQDKLASVSLGKISSTLSVSSQATAIKSITNALSYCLAVPSAYTQAVSTDRLVDD